MSSATIGGDLTVGGSNSGWLPFKQAREYVRALGLNSVKEWQAWSKSGQRPANIPSNPQKAYKGEFISWDDWLGYAPLPYEEAKLEAQKLGIRTRDEWVERHGRGEIPRNLPKWPSNVYKGQFTTWADWLGRPADFRFRSFEDARTFMRALGLKSRREHTEYMQSDACPKDIPSDPQGTYAGKGWVSYDDYLGYAPTRFNRNVVLGLLRSLSAVVHTLQPIEIYTILQTKGVIGKRFPTNRNAGILKSLKRLCHLVDPEAAIEQLTDQLQADGADDGATTEPEQAQVDVLSGTKRETTTLDVFAEATTSEELADCVAGECRTLSKDVDPSDPDQSRTGDRDQTVLGGGGLDAPQETQFSRTEDHLKCVDEVARRLVGFDEELLDFLISNRVAQLWQKVLSKDSTLDIARLRDEPGDVYFQEIKRRFFEQYDGAMNLQVPPGYGYTVDGQPAPPTRMQRLTAYRVLTERRIGNWSGVGAGKTVAAILSTMAVGARVTIVLAFNSTIERWGEEIKAVCSSADVKVKERGPFQLAPETPTFLLYNYESFQMKWALSEVVPGLVDHHRVDFIILDEIQSARQRSEEHESTRRQNINALLERAAAGNPNLHVLGMSATPVINNLHEARTTLEMITGRSFSDSPTEPTVENAVRYHRHLTRHGLRYRPEHREVGEPIVSVVDGVSLLPQLRALPERGYIAKLERILLQAKLRAILPVVRPGTLIYTQFVEEMVEPLRCEIAKMGLSVGLYTGEAKDGLAAFKARLHAGEGGKADVLIGSAPIGTGVDGLQKVCDCLIFACLPWTGAEYEQVVGRLTRLGGDQKPIEVHIPVVELSAPDGTIWSWDRYRQGVIRYKKTIADAALDGVVPEGRLPTKEEMYRQSMIALKEWEKQLQISMTRLEEAPDPLPPTGS